MNAPKPAIGLALSLLAAAFVALFGCGTSQTLGFDGDGGAGSGASGGGGGSGGNGGGGDGGSSGLLGGGSSGTFGSGTNSAAASGTARGTFTAPDCANCTFPDLKAPSCAASVPAIQVVYPIDTVLLPPNMNVISVQWTPFGAPFSRFEVDFENGVTDTRIVTKCATQTTDTGQPPMPSGGCELVVDPKTWAFLVDANRGGPPVTITVRGTTDGTCASTSANSVRVSFAQEDVLGVIYYWKSTVTSNGTGGQIWMKSFGDSNPEQQVTGLSGSALAASCNGCHALSRDGLRMVVYSDDDDSDDEYSDVTGSLIDMTTKNPIGTAYAGRGTGQPPGFSTFSPDHTQYLTSDGLGTAPTNVFTLWSGNAGTQTSTITIGTNAADRPTMPDWSPDGKSVIYALPSKVASWDSGGRKDDDHMFGGSLWTVPYDGNGQFGTPSAFLTSGGENNYYPSYSPDGQYVIFDRAAQDTSVSSVDGCVTSPHAACPNDSFSNPNARLMLTLSTSGNAPIDLQNANGSPASSPVPLSNSWPRWAPFVQTYQGSRLLWFAFSSTRDYGVRVRNHKSGMYQCYPPDSAELPGGAHHSTFDPLCQQPQLWMAPIVQNENQKGDPSRVAFWLPFQDITTHNHTPQWTQSAAKAPTGQCVASGGNCQQNAGGCCNGLACNASGTCASIIQ